MTINHNNKLFFYIAVSAWVLLVFAAYNASNRMSVTMPQAGMFDFQIFFAKCERFIHGGFLYERDLGLYEPLSPVYKFPPLSAAVMVQLQQAGVKAETLMQVGSWIEVALFVLPVMLLVNALVPFEKYNVLLLGGLIVTTTVPALEENITRLQLEPVLFACCALSLLSILRQKDFLAGLLIGLAACLKLYPGVIVLYFILTGRWRSMAGVLLSTALVTIYSVAVLGWAEHVFFVLDLLPVLLREYPITEAESVSIASWARALGMQPAMTKILSQFFLISACGVAARLVLRKHQHDNQRKQSRHAACGFSAMVLAMMIGMPNPLWNYQILLVIPLTVVSSLILSDAIQQQRLPASGMWVSMALVVVALYVGAASTVDDTYYPATFTQKVIISLSRSLMPFVLFGALFVVSRGTTSSSSACRPCQSDDA